MPVFAVPKPIHQTEINDSRFDQISSVFHPHRCGYFVCYFEVALYSRALFQG
jgi:hypothetical protein